MKMCDLGKLVNGYNDRVIDGMKCSVAFLEAIDESLVEAEPVVHAEWMEPFPYANGATCSQCETHSVRRSRYCPNCGARMDQEVH